MFDGPINGERFRAYVEQFLVPTLKPNDIVILDNLGSHKGKAVRKAVKAAGARLLFLPKYSPDLNPIEQVFAKIKGFVRKAAPRTLDAIYHAIAQALAAIKPAECKNYLAGAGMRQPRCRTLQASGTPFNCLIPMGIGFCGQSSDRMRSLPNHQLEQTTLSGQHRNRNLYPHRSLRDFRFHGIEFNVAGHLAIPRARGRRCQSTLCQPVILATFLIHPDRSRSGYRPKGSSYLHWSSFRRPASRGSGSIEC